MGNGKFVDIISHKTFRKPCKQKSLNSLFDSADRQQSDFGTSSNKSAKQVIFLNTFLDFGVNSDIYCINSVFILQDNSNPF